MHFRCVPCLLHSPSIWPCLWLVKRTNNEVIYILPAVCLLLWTQRRPKHFTLLPVMSEASFYTICLSVFKTQFCVAEQNRCCLFVCLSVYVKWTPVIRNLDVTMCPLMIPKYYTTLRAVLQRFWAKYIFFCTKNNTANSTCDSKDPPLAENVCSHGDQNYLRTV